MATTIKDKGAGSSMEKMKKKNSLNIAKKTPTKSSQASSSDQKPIEKPIPNYLKPTISSSLDFSVSRILRRSTTEISTKPTKPATTIRRHPVEKPPLPVQAHKAQSAKPAPQRSVSTLSSKPTKTSIRRSLSSKAGSSNNNGDPKKVATKTGSKNDLDVAHKQAVQSDHDVLENPATVMKEEVDDDQEQKDEEAQEQDDNRGTDENVELAVVIEEEKSIDNKEEEEEASESEEHVEQEKVEEKDEPSEEGSEEAKKTESSAKQTEESGKEAQDNNGVIEETATKLMEDNKNKVMALAGAFETVISLQDTK